MAMTTYPLNNVQYKAEDAELYNAVRISGVWSGSAFDADVTGSDTIVTVGEGLAWIANTKFSGKVVAQKEQKTLDLGVADPSYNRIDVVAIQFDSVENRTDIIVKKGVASSNPEIPARSTTESLYELYLYSVLRTAGSSVISKSNITDLRDNREYCGYMQDSIKPGYAPSLMEHNNGEDFRFWVGTEAEYKAEKDAIQENTFCIIVDDNTEENLAKEIKSLQTSKAPIGLSIGLYETIDKTDASYNAIFDEVLGKMENHTFANFTVGIKGWFCHCTIYKTSNDYAVVDRKSYDLGSHRKEKFAGRWNDWKEYAMVDEVRPKKIGSITSDNYFNFAEEYNKFPILVVSVVYKDKNTGEEGRTNILLSEQTLFYEGKTVVLINGTPKTIDFMLPRKIDSGEFFTTENSIGDVLYSSTILYAP